MSYSHDKRRSKRIVPEGAIAVTANGVCRIVNISDDGIALQCVADCALPVEWPMDIYDVNGFCVEKLRVKKIWEKPGKRNSLPTSLLIDVGGCFHFQSPSKKTEIQTYLQRLSQKKEAL